jgi:hypothetical protein
MNGASTGSWSDPARSAFLGAVWLLILNFLRMLAGPPNVLAPLSVVVLVTWMFLGPLGPFILPVAFWIYGFSLFAARDRMPSWFVLFIAGLGILDCFWLYRVWSVGVGYEGPFLTALVTGLSLATYLAALALVVWARFRPSLKSHFFGAWGFFVWLTMFSFPLFGQPF